MSEIIKNSLWVLILAGWAFVIYVVFLICTGRVS